MEVTNQAAANNTQDQVKKTPQLVLKEPTPFPSVMETIITDTKSFCHVINSLFIQVFPQFRMTTIDVVPAGNSKALNCLIYFDENNGAVYDGEQTFKAIEPTVEKGKKSSDTMSKINTLNGANKVASRQLSVYKFTQDAEDILKDFVPSMYIKNDGHIDWKNASQERTINIRGVQTQAVLLAVDMAKVVRTIYGRKAADGSRLDYAIMVGNPIASSTSIGSPVPEYSYSLFIMRSNEENVRNLCQAYGIGDRMMTAR